MTDGLADQVALITGASSGIGRAIAFSLASQGMRLCLVGRRPEVLEEVAAVARKSSSQALCYYADLTIDEDIFNLKTKIEQDLGRLDLLIHSAGTIAYGTMQTVSIQDLDMQYRANVRAPYLLTQTLLPLLITRQGQIVFINSTAIMRARADVGQFAATQHALKGITDSLREELNPKQVRVLSIYPGRTATSRQETLYKWEGKTYHPELLLQPEDIAAVVLNALCMPRTAEVTDISIRPFKKST